jgi:hypothetical protein
MQEFPNSSRRMYICTIATGTVETVFIQKLQKDLFDVYLNMEITRKSIDFYIHTLGYDFLFESTNIWKKSRDFWFANFFA